MLIQFNFKNYKSYLNETNLDLTASSYSEIKENLISAQKEEKYLKVVSVYGANASGKSNILEAFSHMQHWVLHSFELSGNKSTIPLKRFKFCEEGKKSPTLFEVFFEYKGNEYQYGYTLDETKIITEWLYKRNFNFKSKYELVIEREGQTFNLRKDFKKAKDLLGIMNERTLMISLLSSLEIEDINNVADWFKETKVINFGNIDFEFMISNSLLKVDLTDDEQYKNFIQFLKNVDLGIQGIRKEKISQERSNSINEDTNKYQVWTKHMNIDTGNFEEILLEDESSGTFKMICLYRFIDEALKHGRTLLVDEMDAKLHPLLTRFLINLFHNDEYNKKNAQLIFTTHDTNALTNEIFRRDQIWFVEKNDDGISELFSLSEYKTNSSKVRKDATYNKDYLGGRYGAIPKIRMKAGD